MGDAKKHWKRGRGKLGFLAPLLGSWSADAESPMGSMRCTRTFEQVLGSTYIRLVARWFSGKGVYEEFCLIGAAADGTVHFWSFTSDGKHSEGSVADVTDLHPEAIGFEAIMPAGIARMAYWPDAEEGFHWVVESKTKKGWNRFVEHHYRMMT